MTRKILLTYCPLHDRESSDVFTAIAHPALRLLLDLLAAGGPRPVKDLAYPFSMSRSAISQHLRVLKDAGLVVEERAGRERHYRVEPRPLREATRWLDR